MDLSEKEQFRYSALEKGYEGEVKFDKLTENLQEERYIINDLLLEVNNSYIQIDTLILSQGVIHLLDIKNYQGDYYIDSDKLYTVATQGEYKNPVDQLKRSTTLFSQLLRKLNQNFLVESRVTFINPEFTLYQASMDLPIIFPPQVNRFINDFNKSESKLSERHKQLAQQLISHHQNKNPYGILPKYTYEQLKKGIYCKTCGSFLISKTGYFFLCKSCGGQERFEKAILRNVEEFILLFPDKKITTKNIYEWIDVYINKRTISRMLKKNYKSQGKTRDTYYK